MATPDGPDEPLHAFGWRSDESASAAVVTALSAVSGDDVTAIEPLYDAVDPDALDQLVTPTSGVDTLRTGRVTLEHHGYRVVVDASGRGFVYARDDSSVTGEPRGEVAEGD